MFTKVCKRERGGREGRGQREREREREREGEVCVCVCVCVGEPINKTTSYLYTTTRQDNAYMMTFIAINT